MADELLKMAYMLFPLVNECNADFKKQLLSYFFYFTMSIVLMKFTFEERKRVQALSGNVIKNTCSLEKTKLEQNSEEE